MSEEKEQNKKETEETNSKNDFVKLQYDFLEYIKQKRYAGEQQQAAEELRDKFTKEVLESSLELVARNFEALGFIIENDKKVHDEDLKLLQAVYETCLVEIMGIIEEFSVKENNDKNQQ